MNMNEIKMLDILKKLNQEHGVSEIKAEFENEGSRMDELCRLKDLTARAGLELLIKIGGVEAITAIYQCLVLGVDSIVAPMAETPFAVSKFTDGIEKFVPDDNRSELNFLINIETITAVNNFEEMLKLPGISSLSGITIGRVDLTASMGKDRSFANSTEMLSICERVLRMAREKGMKTLTIGGAVSPDSEDFLKHLIAEDLVDRYETRKVVYPSSTIENFHEALEVGISFELEWLKSKQRYYHRLKVEDESRIKMLEARLNG